MEERIRENAFKLLNTGPDHSLDRYRVFLYTPGVLCPRNNIVWEKLSVIYEYKNKIRNNELVKKQNIIYTSSVRFQKIHNN